MTNERPTPEQMLARLRSEGGPGETARRGRLKLFVGYAAGVGKTYAMLKAAHALREQGRDVVIGYIEPHARPETMALVEGLEQLPTLALAQGGASAREFDLDAALARRPEVILIDELAHTNAAGVRHAKRWQDVEDLLDAGISVFSTLNIQHLESLNDVVAQISGVAVRETVPDDVLEKADDVSLVDLPPDELMQRLREGKIYIPEQAAHALERFFRKENLVALRELALRQTADRVHEDVETARRARAAQAPWPTNERLLVCVGPSPSSAKVVRAAKRFADRLDAEWIALHVETPDSARRTPNDRDRLHLNLQLAERLGAEVVQISGEQFVPAALDYAASRNVTKIVVGKTEHVRRWSTWRSSLVDQLVQHSGQIDIFVVRGVDAPPSIASSPVLQAQRIGPWLWTVATLVIATLIALLFHAIDFGEANVVLAYLSAVVVVASRWGRLQAIVASIAAVVLFNFLFTEPFYSLNVYNPKYLLTFVVMLGAALLSSALTARVRYQAEVSRRSQRRTEALYRLSRRLTALAGERRLVDEAERVVAEVFDVHAVIYLPDAERRIRPILGQSTFAASAAEFAAAQWVFDHRQLAGAGTDTLPASAALYLPLVTPNGVVGVLAVQSRALPTRLDPEARSLLETFATQIALAIERDQLTTATRLAQVEVETERLRSALLSAVSHDLRTPLSAIAGASSALQRAQATLDENTKAELLSQISDEAQRLGRLVENLLHMTKLADGQIEISRHWQPIDEVIGSALARMRRELEGRSVTVEIPNDVPFGHFDELLVEQLLVNLLENAAKYSPPDAAITVRVAQLPSAVSIEVADRGRGLAAGDEQRVFEMFYRGAGATDRRGAGLGLAICRAVARAHRGTIEARRRDGGGTVFHVTLPFAENPPAFVSSGAE